MKREIQSMGGNDSGFNTLEAAIAFCKERPGINYAKIGFSKEEKYSVIIAAFDHWSPFYHWVAEYKLVAQITLIDEKDQ